jgi:peptidoglycan-N-acetylglucosamine deacetylase
MAEAVYLTFDDGPDPQWTPRVLEVLAAHGAVATFFMVGQRALAEPGLARAVVAAGHALGNHSFSHRHPWTMSAAAARREVRDGAAALAEACGRPARFFRPPYGRLRRCMSDEAARGGQRVVLWDRSAIDWGPLGRGAAIAGRLEGIRPGEIVLMHDGAARRNRPEELLRVLPGLLDGLAARGLRALSLPAQPLPGAGTSAPQRHAG